MPFHLPAANRRQFLQVAGLGSLACSSIASGADAAEVEDDLVYLLNDTHVGERHPPSSSVPSHLRLVVDELVQRTRPPAAVLINGDLALKDGQPGDYRHFAKLIAPLGEAQVDTHLTLGNHDNRDAFYQIMQEERPDDPQVTSRHISILKTRWANFFLLDSLKETMVTQGTIGMQQRTWLAQSLDAHPTKPAIIVTHHNPRLGGDPLHFPGGLIDSRELWDILVSRPQVKAYIHGHIHDRSNAQHEGIHIINTPATSYVADPKTSTTGWTTARLTANSIAMTTRTTDPMHPWNGETRTLTWRSDG